MLKTPLYQQHVDAKARMMEFGGWSLPVNYGSQVEEHHACRKHAAMFDVSHMTVVDMAGGDKADGQDKPATQFLQHLLANDVTRLKSPGDALYTCMLAPDGGILDDLIVYWRGGDAFRLILNAATREKDLAWIKAEVDKFSSPLEWSVQDDLALLAVQGPAAIGICSQVLDDINGNSELSTALKSVSRFSSTAIDEIFIGRTGYTGEDGVEMLLPSSMAPKFWQNLLDAGVQPAGLGARDTLRLEAAMNLYGSDMDESVNPFECGIGWSVALEPDSRNFIGRSAIVESLGDTGRTDRQMIGIVLEDRGVLRGHQAVMMNGREVGSVTSGTYSPTQEQSIAMARVSLTACEVSKVSELTGQACQVEIRKKLVDARVVKRPFLKSGT